MTKILYLDIDGPVVPLGSFFRPVNSHGLLAYSTDVIQWINEMCSNLDVKVVISSTKRIGGQLLLDELNENGFDLGHLHDDWCIDLPIGERSPLIRKHMARNNITVYASLDDETLDDDLVNVHVSGWDGTLIEHMACLYMVYGNRGIYDMLVRDADYLDVNHPNNSRARFRVNHIDNWMERYKIPYPEKNA